MKNLLNIFKTIELKRITLNDNYILLKREGVFVNVPSDLNEVIMSVYSDEYESGGFILGYKIESLDEYTIKEITLPMLGDKSTKFSLNIANRHVRSVNKSIKGDEMTVLGLWHTHPGSNTPNRPSNDDIHFFNKILGKSSFPKNIHTITNNSETTVMFYSKEKGAKLCQ